MGPRPKAGPPRAADGTYDYMKAGLFKRFLAYLVDNIIGFLPMSAVGIIAFFIFMAQAQSPQGPGGFMMILVFLLGGLAMLWGLVYTLVRDGFGRGQSWGKKIMGLMVVDITTNEPCTMGKSVLRNVIFFALGFVGFSFVEYLIPLFQGKGARLGDMVAKTQVIEADQYR